MKELEKLEQISENCDDEPLQIFLSAINDWRNQVFSFHEYYDEVCIEIGSNPTKTSIELYVSKVDYSKKAWEVESLSGLLTIYDYFDDSISLKDVFDNLKGKYLD